MVRGNNQPVSGKPDLSHWELVDIFTVDQAACLWAGIDPSKNRFKTTVSETSRLASIDQFLSAAIQTGQIPADSSKNTFEIIGNYSKSLVTRDDLKTLANSQGQQPNFLFDTLMPEIGGKELPRRKSFPLVRGNNQPVSGKPDLSHWELVDIFTVDQSVPMGRHRPIQKPFQNDSIGDESARLDRPVSLGCHSNRADSGGFVKKYLRDNRQLFKIPCHT